MQVIAPVTVARAAAWGLLFGGWLTVGALAQWQAAPGWASALPHAVWLLALATLPGLAARASLSDGVLGALLLTLAVAAAAGVLLQVPAAMLALPWAALVVAASRVVRRLRPPQPLPAGAVLAAAAGGVIAAWLLAGDAAQVAGSPAPLALAVLAAAALAAWALRTAEAPSRGGAAAACRRSLVDCALAWPAPGQWRDLQRAPWLAAALVMLPAMAGVPALATQCAALGLPPWATSGAHAMAMLLPAALLLAAPPRAQHRARAAVTGLMVTGALAPWLWAGAAGLLAAMLLQSAAWSLAWCAAQLLPQTVTGAPRPAVGGLGAVVGAAVLLLIGHAMPDGWLWLHTLLGLAALGPAWGRVTWGPTRSSTGSSIGL